MSGRNHHHHDDDDQPSDWKSQVHLLPSACMSRNINNLWLAPLTFRVWQQLRQLRLLFWPERHGECWTLRCISLPVSRSLSDRNSWFIFVAITVVVCSRRHFEATTKTFIRQSVSQSVFFFISIERWTWQTGDSILFRRFRGATFQLATISFAFPRKS